MGTAKPSTYTWGRPHGALDFKWRIVRPRDWGNCNGAPRWGDLCAGEPKKFIAYMWANDSPICPFSFILPAQWITTMRKFSILSMKNHQYWWYDGCGLMILSLILLQCTEEFPLAGEPMPGQGRLGCHILYWSEVAIHVRPITLSASTTCVPT